MQGIHMLILLGITTLGMICLLVLTYQLRKNLQTERALCHDIFDHPHLCIWTVKPDKTIVRLNSYSERLIGVKGSEIIGRKYDEIAVLRNSWQEVIVLLNDALAQKFVENKEVVIFLEDQDQYRTFSFRTSAINGASGTSEPSRIMLIGLDIHERRMSQDRLQSSYQELEATYQTLTATQEEMKRQYDELVVNQEKLRVSEERFRLATRGSGAVIWDIDPALGTYFVSDRFYDLLGYERGEVELTVHGLKKIIHPDDWVDTERSRQACLSGCTPVYESEYRIRKKDGEYLWMQVRGITRRNGEGQVVRFAGSMIDITERKRYELKLEESCRELESACEELTKTQRQLLENYKKLVENQDMLSRSEKQHRLVIEASNAGIWEIDLLRNKRYYSPRWFELLGYTQDDHVSSEILDNLIHPEDVNAVQKAMDDVTQGRKELFECEYRLRVKSGEYRWFLGRGKALFDKRGRAYRMAGIHEDIHELKLSQEKLRQLAYYDTLSGLPNRLYMLKELEEYFAASDAMAAIFFVDTDNFKYVNDTLGHKFGDQLLIEASRRLTSMIGNRAMLFRFGGDEFVVFMRDIQDESEAIAVAERVITGFKEPFRMNDSDLAVSVSVGISFYPKDGRNVEEILRNADVAMYNAKEAGKGKYVLFDPAFLRTFNERVQLETQLRHGIENNEFILHYQPKISRRTGRIMGFEALIRWNSSVLGPLSPLTFIRIAEDSRLIVPIGEWVLAESCRFAAKLQFEAYGQLRISVNISIVQLVQEDFVDMVLRILKDTGLSPEHLELEITESVSLGMICPDVLIGKLEKLQAAGVHLALDNFGTGYISLSYLQQLPLTTLKISPSFITQISDQGDECSLARAMVLIGRRMGLNIVAEGVETVKQLEHVKQSRYDLIQGFYISRPLPEEEALTLIRSNKVYNMC
ncbi:sensor domain-containing protein [Paenibacillus lentus]|uniref:EAL domain-containing protein n=1 Tax=Paenibacillus lentus TaxID=1338368 RepID=A0A3S8RQN2_9BACL|nr:GGDEF and EAL domain-containing protein [Paenibacillus lentus]AZK45238.1 EAL domain-containing protein [Paenibacillus lentus]